MNDMLRLAPTFRKTRVELSNEEQAQLNTIIDLLIPSDKDFPPPSSLDLIDDILLHVSPRVGRKNTPMLSEKRLRTALNELNLSADGNFCLASTEMQQSLLRHLEYRDPAFFQALWTLVNHSYYALLATRWHPQMA